MIKKIALTITLLGFAAPVGAYPVTFSLGNKPLQVQPKTFSKPVPIGVKSLRQKASEAFGDLQYDDAISLLDQAITADPNNLELRQDLFSYLKVGGTAWVTPFPRRAIKLLTRAISIQPNDAFLWSRRGDAYCEIADFGPTSPKARPYIKACAENHRQAVKLAESKGYALSRAATAFTHISPVESAKLFDMAASAYLREGNREAAKESLLSKDIYGLP